MKVKNDDQKKNYIITKTGLFVKDFVVIMTFFIENMILITEDHYLHLFHRIEDLDMK